MNARHVGSRVFLVGGHRGLVANLKHIDLVMGDPSALLHRSLSRPHVHASVELQGVRGDDLTRAARTQRTRKHAG